MYKCIEVILMVLTPDVQSLPFTLYNGIKYFELVAEPVRQEILPGLFINGLGYNGSIPGPTIQVYHGDDVNIRVYNMLPEATSIHWHGLDVPNVMDGVPDIEPSPKIDPGWFFDYRFKVINPPGTHMYHTHFDSVKQQMSGLGGAFIILPDSAEPDVQKDYFLMLQEFALKGLDMGEVKPGIFDLDVMTEDFNFFTINGKCFPAVTQLAVKFGDRVRIRMGNIVHNAHPMHIHGHQFIITACDGNPVPYQSRLVKNTVNVASGETYDIEFTSNNPGRWPFHCHIPHHMSNNMRPEMGGMSTVIVYE